MQIRKSLQNAVQLRLGPPPPVDTRPAWSVDVALPPPSRTGPGRPNMCPRGHLLKNKRNLEQVIS